MQDKAEHYNWAGTVIDESIVSDLESNTNGIDFLSEYAIKYKVRYKIDIDLEEDYILKIVKGISNVMTLKTLKKV